MWIFEADKSNMHCSKALSFVERCVWQSKAKVGRTQLTLARKMCNEGRTLQQLGSFPLMWKYMLSDAPDKRPEHVTRLVSVLA